ncbi:MAG: hypothetical protein AB7E61_02080 [Acholeplasmataceae bacterium]
MNRWIKIIIYLLFVIFLSYLVAMFSEAAIVVDYLKDQQETIQDEPLPFLAATVIANSHDGTDVYILNTPLYEETFDVSLTSQHVVVSIYTLVEYKGDEAHNSIVILLNDIELSNDDAYVDNDNYHTLNANITFDRPITINEYTASTFNETFVTAYDDQTKLILLNTNYFETTAGVAEIERIDITYTLTSGDEVNFVTLYNADKLTMVANDTFDTSFNRNINQVTPTNIDIFSVYGLTAFKDNANIYYDATWLETLMTYNSYYFRFAIYELLVLLPITYFLFIHKYVRRNLKDKKELKKQQYEAEQEALKNKFRDEDSKPL